MGENPYLSEGIAQYVTELFYGTAPEDVGSGRMRTSLGLFAPAVTRQRINALFTGNAPTAEQMRNGSIEELDFWYVIAASAFGYLGEQYGVNGALWTARCAYTGKRVFVCASELAEAQGKPISAEQLQTQWARWVRSSYG